MSSNKYQWQHIKDVDTLVPDYPKQGTQFYVVTLEPNPSEPDPFIDQGYVTTIPGYLLGQYRNRFVYSKQNWQFMTVESYYLWLAALLTEGTDAATKELIRKQRNDIEDLKARVLYFEGYQARVQAFHKSVFNQAEEAGLL